MKLMMDEIINLYMKDVDRTLLRENLKLTPTERIEKLMAVQEFIEEMHRAGHDARTKKESAQVALSK
jgi:hypothetical protein